MHSVENFIEHEPKFTSHSPVTIHYSLKTKKAYNGITIKHGLTNYEGLKTDLTLVNYDEGVFYFKKKPLKTCTNNDNDSKIHLLLEFYVKMVKSCLSHSKGQCIYLIFFIFLKHIMSL